MLTSGRGAPADKPLLQAPRRLPCRATDPHTPPLLCLPLQSPTAVLGPAAAMSYLATSAAGQAGGSADKALCQRTTPMLQQLYSRLRAAGEGEAERGGRGVVFASTGPSGEAEAEVEAEGYVGCMGGTVGGHMPAGGGRGSAAGRRLLNFLNPTPTMLPASLHSGCYPEERRQRVLPARRHHICAQVHLFAQRWQLATSYRGMLQTMHGGSSWSPNPTPLPHTAPLKMCTRAAA